MLEARGRLSFLLFLAGAVLAGLLLGTVTNVLQGVLPDRYEHLANSGAVWVVLAFAAGLAYPRTTARAAGLGVGTQVGAVVGYYGDAEVVRDGAGNLHAPIVWLGFALVAGSIFGAAGAWWRERRRLGRVPAAALLGGVFGMDGLWSLWRLSAPTQGCVLLAIGAAIPLLIGRSGDERVRGTLAVLPLAFVAVGVLAVALSATGLG